VTESLREVSFLKESLSVVTLGAVGVLRFEPMSSSLSPEEDNAKTSREAFLEIEMPLEKCLTMQQV